jgi:predicted nucleic acid-binding protein
MTGPFVADCSVGIGWIHPSQANDQTRRLLEHAKEGTPVYVPSIWHLEMANALLVAVRRKLLTEAHRQAGLALLTQLRLIIDHETSALAFSAISDLSVRYSLTAYDAAYLELARRRSIPLGSRDEPLRAAARRYGVKLV